MNIGLRNLQQFGAVQSWSGYFVAMALTSTLRSLPTQIAFHVGRQDSRFLTMNRQYDASLSATGIAHIFHTYPGGHSPALWGAQAPTWLRWALDYLAAQRSAPSRATR